jgi:hypothetical protein
VAFSGSLARSLHNTFVGAQCAVGYFENGVT